MKRPSGSVEKSRRSRRGTLTCLSIASVIASSTAVLFYLSNRSMENVSAEPTRMPATVEDIEAGRQNTGSGEQFSKPGFKQPSNEDFRAERHLTANEAA